MSHKTLDGLFLAAIATVTWEAMRFAAGPVDVTWSDILISLFLACVIVNRMLDRDSGLPRQAATLAGFMLVFLVVYLCGYFDLSTREALAFWTKGIIVWLAHALFLVFGVAYVVRRGTELYQRAIKWLLAGIVVCSAYGLVQLATKVAIGLILDQLVVGTLTLGRGKTNGINIYGQVGGTENIYRINALTGDPNHLGVMLCLPLLMLLPVYLADTRGRRRLGMLLGFLFFVQVLTLSRSAALGDIVGLLVLLPYIRPILPRARTLILVGGGGAALIALLYSTSHFVHTVIDSRTSTSGEGVAVHFQFYQLVPPALDPNPLFGMGFNTFAVFYEFVTGKVDFGPHSFWIATLVETGMIGLTVYLAYFGYTVLSAATMRRSESDYAARLGTGMLAAIVGTAAANFFYLTMSFPYFFVMVLLTIAGAALYAPKRAPERTAAPEPAGTLAM